MSVAVPPALEARTKGISIYRGLRERDTQISMATPVNNSMVVTLSRNAEDTAVKTIR